jgi:phosphoglycerate dehydrogenase-like enzyme
MRVLLSRDAYTNFWDLADRPGLQPVILEADGTVTVPDGGRVPAEEADTDLAWGTFDLFVEGGQGRVFMGIVARAPSLQWFQSMAAGYDNPLFPALAGRGVRLSVTHVNGVSIAEYVMHAVLDHYLDAKLWRENQARREWRTHEFREVEGTTWLVIGLGSIGGRVSRRAAAFGATVIGCRRNPEPDDPADRLVTPAQLATVIPEADVVVLAAPAGPETDGMVDAAFLGSMKPRSVLVNVARGSLVDDDALLTALERGAPEAAILDVSTTEPLPADHPFWTHPSITITPHNAAFGIGRGRRQAELFAENLDLFVTGEPLVHEITDLVR